MGDVVEFKRKTAKEKHKGKTLCRHGFHKWAVKTGSKFDVKKGKLVTVSVCTRCGVEKNEAK